MVPYAIVDDVGDHLMPQQSVLCSPDDQREIAQTNATASSKSKWTYKNP